MKWTLSLAIVVCLHLVVAQQFTLPLVVGDRTEALFDLWSVQHFLSGVFIGTVLLLPEKRSLKDLLTATLIVAFIWEAAELAMEYGIFGQVISSWKSGFEHWGNRFIGDPLMVVFGSMFAWKFSSAWKWAFIPASVWLVANVVSPTSMSIQQWLL